MTSLDERIAALFRKGPAPSVDHPIVEEAPSEAVVSEPAGEEENENDDKTTLSSRGTMAAKISSPWAEAIPAKITTLAS